MARTGRDLLLSHLHETCRWYPRRAVTVRRDFPANCEKEGEPTSGLEPLTCSETGSQRVAAFRPVTPNADQFRVPFSCPGRSRLPAALTLLSSRLT